MPPNDMACCPGPFAPDWESLRQYRCPDWFRDAKFGIWAHWGPQSVPGAGDWYARNMYIEGHAQYLHHVKTYGHPSKFGFKDIVALWTADQFDPDRLMELYVRAGAKYFVAQGVHHDNFDNWNSRHHRWNAVKKGPKKDIVGLWRAAALKRGLRFGVTEHLERSYCWFNTNKGRDQSGPLAGVPYDGNDPAHAEFYFPPHPDTSFAYPVNPPEWWPRQWFLRIQDLVDQYEPDLLYTDGAVPFGETGRKLVAHFYNGNIRRHGGRSEAVYAVKNAGAVRQRGDQGDYRDGVGVLDIERGVVKEIRAEPWQTDTCIGDWFYKTGIRYKSAPEIIQMLADVVSKNGNLLLNFPQRADGTLDDSEERILADLADWMAVNGEAIHGTRPWRIYGEGPTQFAAGTMAEKEGRTFTPQDFRFTEKPGVLYAICLAAPAPSAALTVRSLSSGQPAVTSVALLGCRETLRWSCDAAGLHVQLPAMLPCAHAVTLRIGMTA